MYFDRILFSAAFATLLGTAAMATAQSFAAPDSQASAEAAAELIIATTPSLDPVVVTGKREASRI